MGNYANITLKITDKLISIRGGCNIQTGYFNVSEGNKVSIGPFTSTRMGCEKDYDSELINKLVSVSKYSISGGGVLVLSDKENKQVAKCNKVSNGDEVIDINKIINEMKGITT